MPAPAPALTDAAAPPWLGVVLRSLAPWALMLAAAFFLHFALGPVMSRYHVNILLLAGVNIILAVSLNMVNGMTGQFSIGHAGFMAVGGYTAAAITYYCGARGLWPDGEMGKGTLSWTGKLSEMEGPLLQAGDGLFLVATLAGGVAAAVAGLVVGLPSLRLRGDYLAIVTLGFGEIVRVLIELTGEQLRPADNLDAMSAPLKATESMAGVAPLDWFNHLGGPLGMTDVPPFTSLFWVWFFVALTLIVAYRLRLSSHGRAFLSIREDAVAAVSMGIPVTRYKVTAFVFAAFFAGLAGSLYAHTVGVALTPGDMAFQRSFEILIAVVLAGTGSISGTVIAAFILTLLPEWLRKPTMVWPAALPIVVVILLLAWGRRIDWKRARRLCLSITAATVAVEVVRLLAVAAGIKLADYRMVIYALALILIMLLRPQGLFGTNEIWDLARLAFKRKAIARAAEGAKA